MWKRIQSWRGKPISQAGREVLIKAAAQAIPAYGMSTFLFPISLADELQRMLNSFWWGSKKNGGRSLNWLGWNKLCVQKESGGLGFRDLYSFNLAMLGKQGWKLLSDPDALICKVFKARYYPHGDFLNAKLGHNPSYVWKSIWSSRVLLEKGIRWKVGDGRQIKVWKDPWLRDSSNMKLESPLIPDLSDLVVHDLMIPSQKNWDIELLHELFNERDVNQIISIPLGVSNHEDRLIWHFSENGIYNVKSGYKIVAALCPDVNVQVQEEWKRLWALKLPSKDCWHNSGLHEMVDSCVPNAESFTELFFIVLTKLEGLERAKFCMILWNIWRQRNDKVWNNTYKNLATTVRLALDFLSDWLGAKQIFQATATHNSLDSSCTDWHKPAPSFVKCNVDAAFFSSEQKVGLVCVLRDDKGMFLSCRTCIFVGMVSVKEGEAIGLLEAILWVQQLGLKKVCFELDAKVVVDAINSSSADV